MKTVVIQQLNEISILERDMLEAGRVQDLSKGAHTAVFVHICAEFLPGGTGGSINLTLPVFG